jgi:hypothetical protein
MARMNETVNFFKDLSLAGGALAFYALATAGLFGSTLFS